MTDLTFADDSAIFMNDDIEATDILYDIAHTAKSFELEINTDKTKVLTMDGLLLSENGRYWHMCAMVVTPIPILQTYGLKVQGVYFTVYCPLRILL